MHLFLYIHLSTLYHGISDMLWLISSINMDRNTREIIYRQVLFYTRFMFLKKVAQMEQKIPIYNSVFPGG